MLVAVGLNQKGAGVADRELLAIPADGIEEALSGYAALDGIEEVAVLSTCYRVEIYAWTRCPAAASVALRRALEGRAGREVPLFELHGDEAFRHLVRVASSLESAIVGEPQILGQVKDAFRRAVEVGVGGSELTNVLNRALAIAKRVRTETALGRAGVSWGHAASVLAEKVIGDLKGRKVAVLGAGEMARVAAQHLATRGASIAVLNRTLANAEALAREVNGVALPIGELDAQLRTADVVVVAAPLASAAFQPDAMTATARVRRRPLVLVDLAVPRVVPRESAAIRDVYLCDVDDLDRVMQAAMEERAKAVADAERVIAEEIAKWSRGEAERRAAPLIQELRGRASAIAKEEVLRTVRRLGEDPDLARRLDAMAGSIVSKLLHAPSARLKRAVCEDGTESDLVAAAVQIFDLDPARVSRRSA